MASKRKRVQLFHWKPAEAEPLIALLEKGRFSVGYLGKRPQGGLRVMAEENAEAAVIDLTRLPSYGRYWAAEIRSRKKLRHVPIVFVDGDAARVARVRAAVPDAEFTSRDKLVELLRRVKPVADPVQPPRMMASDRPVAEKLGIRPGMQVAVFDPPAAYRKLLGALPAGVALEEVPAEALPLALWFVREEDGYLTGLRAMRQLVAKGSKLWVVYPKKRGTQRRGLNQNFIREAALAVGLVDYKICSVDAVWTGMLFTLKK